MRMGNYTGHGDSVSEALAFDQSFKGIVKHKECYYDPWTKRNKIPQIAKKATAEINKALQVSSPVFAAGNQPVLIPVFVDPDIKLVQQRLTPVRELTPRRASQGKSYDFNQITAIASGTTEAEGAALTEQNDTVGRATVPIKYLYSVGKVTGQMQAAARGYIDAMDYDMTNKALAMARLEENLLINGDATTTPTEFDGFINGITTNTSNKSGAPVTLDDIRESQRLAWNESGEVPPFAVTDGATFNTVKQQLFSIYRQTESAENLPFGIQNSFNFEGTDFIKSQFMPSGASAKRMLFLNPRAFHMAVLQDATFENLAKTGDFEKYMIKTYEALALTAEPWMSQIYGIQ